MPISNITSPNKAISPDLNQILDDVTAQITDSHISFPAHFTFMWNDISFAGQVGRMENKADQYSVNLVASLGFIPFSAENKESRNKLNKYFAPLFIKGDFFLSGHSQIQMNLMTFFTGPVSARRLLEVITFSLLDRQETLKSAYSSLTGAVGNKNF